MSPFMRFQTAFAVKISIAQVTYEIFHIQMLCAFYVTFQLGSCFKFLRAYIETAMIFC